MISASERNFAICEDMAFSMQVLEKSKGICVVPESLYCYHYKEAENLVNRFHENYYEALLYFRDAPGSASERFRQSRNCMRRSMPVSWGRV